MLAPGTDLASMAPALYFCGMSITVVVENDTIKLPPSVHVPDGTKLEITLPEVTLNPKSVAQRYAGLVGVADDMPTDLARNLDHYIHGHAKKP